MTPPQGEYRLVTCAPKPGQRLKREDVDSRDTFFLKDQDDGRCLEFDKNRIELSFFGENKHGFLCGCFFLLIWMTCFFCFNDTVSIVHPSFLKVAAEFIYTCAVC